MGSLRYLLSPAILQTCVRHQDVVWKVLGFHQSKIGEGDSTAPAPTLAPAHPHEPHQWQQRPHYLSPCLLCFKIATCLTHGVTEPCPGGNSPLFILLALPFGLLRRLGLSKGTGHRAGGQVRLPSHTAQAQAVLLCGEVTFKSSPGPCGGRPVLKAGCRIMAWLVLMGHVESWKRKCPWLFICPRTACPCYQHRAAVGHAVVGDARGSAQGPRKTYTMCPVSNRTKSWKGFDSEI